VVSVDDKYEVLHGLYTEPIERRQTSPRASQQTPVKNFTAVKFMVAAGGLTVAPVNAPHLYHTCH